jgi:hypothetical protein
MLLHCGALVGFDKVGCTREQASGIGELYAAGAFDYFKTTLTLPNAKLPDKNACGYSLPLKDGDYPALQYTNPPLLPSFAINPSL